MTLDELLLMCRQRWSSMGLTLRLLILASVVSEDCSLEVSPTLIVTSSNCMSLVKPGQQGLMLTLLGTRGLLACLSLREHL